MNHFQSMLRKISNIRLKEFDIFIDNKIEMDSNVLIYAP